MAKLVEVKEPYVHVNERVITAALNPTAGSDLILGCALISDSGPSVPTLVSSQKEFLEIYSSQDITKEYVDSMNKLYKGDDAQMASTMWLNAYRLAGSNTLLCVRASKAKDINFAKSLVAGDDNAYILRDGQLLRSVPTFKLVISKDGDEADHNVDGWSIAVNEVGVVGNRNTDDGPSYDHYAQNLGELVEFLNESSKFFSPAYKFYKDDKGTEPADNVDEALSVVFEEVYMGVDFLDTTDPRCSKGLGYLVACEPDWAAENPTQKVVDLNGSAYSKFTPTKIFVTNEFNSSTDLKIRIRRFNHDAVLSKELTEPDANKGGNSPYTVVSKILDTFTGLDKKEPSEAVLYRDFYEIAVFDPSVSSSALYFNIGNILGRGDMDVASVNESLKMIQLQLPDNLRDLGLNYYNYVPAGKVGEWVLLENPSSDIQTKAKENTVATKSELKEKDEVGKYSYVTDIDSYFVFTAVDKLPVEELYVDLSINPEKYAILDVSDSDIMKALDQISENEVYVVEGLADVGCTSPMVQSYMANMAINDNYFYPISTINSTNYLAIASSINRISQDSYKLYASSPWDVDTGSTGFKFYASPSTLYWETVGRNRTLGREFAPCFGQSNGIAQYQRPVVEFNKKVRQLLLSKRINTVLWNTTVSAYNWNDNYTKTSEDIVMRDDGNSRLMIRISKAMPVLLSQFKGRRINTTLWKDAYDVIDFWFRDTILPMSYSIEDYKITIDESNNPVEVQRRNQMYVLVEVKYQRALKYIEVYNQAYDVGIEFTGEIVK